MFEHSKGHIMEMAKSFADEWIRGIHLFEYRLINNLPENNMFQFADKIYRCDIDFQCFLTSCRQLERAILMEYKNLDETKEKRELKKILAVFKKETPYLAPLRNVYEHFDDYLTQKGKDSSVDTGGLRVYSVECDNKSFKKDWLNYKVDVKQAVKAADVLYQNFLKLHEATAQGG
jgi:hypothetical protein